MLDGIREQTAIGHYLADKIVAPTPGMATTVEIKTATRHAIAFLLSPLLRYGQESWRER